MVSVTGAPLYTADFTTWFSGTEDGPLPIRAAYNVSTQEYHLALTDPTRGYVYYRYAPEAQGFADFRLDVDARRITGPDNGGTYGVVFRAQPQGSNRAIAQYIFFVTADGAFALNFMDANGTVKNIVPRSTSAAVNKGEMPNHLSIVCLGGQVTLEVNNQVIGTYAVPPLGPGAIGLYVANPANPTGSAGMEVAFKNLRVSKTP